MGRPLVPIHAQTALEHPRFQKAANDSQQTLVADVPGQTGHQGVVIDPVKELFQIEIDDGPASVGHVLPGLTQGLMSPAPRAEAEARLREGRVEYRFQDLQDRLGKGE